MFNQDLQIQPIRPLTQVLVNTLDEVLGSAPIAGGSLEGMNMLGIRRMAGPFSSGEGCACAALYYGAVNKFQRGLNFCCSANST